MNNSEIFVENILKKYGDSLKSSINGLDVLTAYLKIVLPGFQKIKLFQACGEDFSCIEITFCPYPKFYEPESHFLKFISNSACVHCSNNSADLLEAIEVAMKYDNLGIGIDNESTVFFNENSNFINNNFHLFKKGMTAKDIIETITKQQWYQQQP